MAATQRGMPKRFIQAKVRPGPPHCCGTDPAFQKQLASGQCGRLASMFPRIFASALPGGGLADELIRAFRLREFMPVKYNSRRRRISV